MEPSTSAAGLPLEAVDRIALRLCDLGDDQLRFPGRMTQEGSLPDREQRQRYFQALLQHDPGVLLERHGEALTAAEREEFRPLRCDYEVNFWLSHMEDKAAAPPEDARPGQVTPQSRNRRLAKLARLEREGYFEDDAMRRRQPYLHHLYVGQYRAEGANISGAAAQPGEARPPSKDAVEAAAAPVAAPVPVLAQSIMWQQEEVELATRREAERERYAQMESSEEEEEEEEDEVENAADRPAERGGSSGGAPAGEGGDIKPSHVKISESEREEYSATFLDLMKQKFLGGDDEDIDYAAIDAGREAGLDDDLAAEATRDIEERYFEGD